MYRIVSLTNETSAGKPYHQVLALPVELERDPLADTGGLTLHARGAQCLDFCALLQYRWAMAAFVRDVLPPSANLTW
jgi:hypothetical protein